MGRPIPQWAQRTRGFGALMRRRSAAQALVWLTLAIPLFISTAGLAIDGGVLLASRRQLQSVADGAARAGATRLDLARLRDSGGGDGQFVVSLGSETANSYPNERLAGPVAWAGPPQ